MLSNSPAKPSKPSRAYLHLTKEEHINLLADKVRQTSFVDIKATSKDPALLGPPTVEFAPYGRIPSNRGRNDLRQGTIDQDQEFIDFLESLTNPITRPATVDQGSDAASKIKEKIIVTPLIQFLKDKKANKSKDTSTTLKGVKHTRHDSKEGRITPVIDKRPSSKAGNPSASPEKRSAQAIKIEKAAREVVRAINKQSVTAEKTTVSPATTANAKTIPTPTTVSTPLAEKKRERGNASAAAKILQRDLGIGAASSGRGGRRVAPAKLVSDASNPILLRQDSLKAQPPKDSENNATPASASQDKAVSPASSSVLPNDAKILNNAQPPKGPATTRTSSKPAAPEIKTVSSNPTTNIVKNPVSPTATQAFLKHANPSQGITEPLLEEAFIKYGAVQKVEIDKKKGFAYIDFAEPKGLQDAIRASPIKVGQGQVVVLERKTGPTLQARNVRGGSHTTGNRGGAPMGPRGGRGSGRRGGLGRGGATISSHNNLKASAVPTSSSQANATAEATVPAMATSPAITETTSGPTSMPTSSPHSTPLGEKAPSDPLNT